MSVFSIHTQLLNDCYYLGRLPATEVLLHRNASVPWFILVPETDLTDILDLQREHRDAVMTDCALVSSFLKQILGLQKVNFAGLGNVVPQMHLHIIGRAPVDPCWPLPVWGNLNDTEAYDRAQVLDWQKALQRMGEMRPVPLEDF